MSTTRYRHWIASCLLVGTVALGSCSTSDGVAAVDATASAPDGEPEDQRDGRIDDPQSSAEDDVSRLQPAEVTVTVTGAVRFEWTERRDLRVVTLANTDADLHVLSVGLEQMQGLGEREYFRFAFDYVEPYEGSGTYEIPAREDGAAQSLVSGAFVVWTRVTDVDAEPLFGAPNLEEVHDFNQVRQACTIEIGVDEAEGSLTCPELESEDGSTVALQVTWRPTSP